MTTHSDLLRSADAPVPFDVTVRASTAFRESNTSARREAMELAGPGFGGFRSAPLLVMRGTPGARTIVVGRWFLWMQSDGLRAQASVRGVWVEADGWRRAKDVTAHLDQIRSAGPFNTPHLVASVDPQEVLTVSAKATAEESRTSVMPIRELCYEISETISEGLRPDSPNSPEGAVPQLMSVRAAISLARDEAREAVRNQFSLSTDDKDAYHRYRRAMDPSLMTPYEPADVSTRPWMRTHDAGMRQCQALVDQLAEQIEMLSNTLEAASTMWTAQQAHAAEGLNKIATAAAFGFGMPSVVLAYYGADRLLPLHPAWTLAALLPIAFGAFPVAVYLTDHRPVWFPSGPRAWRAAVFVASVGAVLGLGIFAHWVISAGGS